MCYEHDLGERVKPDICTLGKAISGGITPVSGILANDNLMNVIKPGDHGSTYGGNPLGMAIAKAAVKAIVDEDMTGNSARLGAVFEKNLKEMKSPLIKEVRARGLFAALEFNDGLKEDGFAFCKVMMKHGLVTKATGPKVIRFAPALIITEQEVHQASEIIERSLKDFEAMN